MTADPMPTSAPGHRLRPWMWLGPNLPVTCLALFAATVELMLLMLRSDNIYQLDGLTSLQAVLVVICFWLSAAWCGWFSSRIVVRLLRAFPGPLQKLTLAIVWLTFGWLLIGYLAAWRQYLGQGDFGYAMVARHDTDLVTTSTDSWLPGLTSSTTLAVAAVWLLAGALAVPQLHRRLIAARWAPPIGDTRRLALRRIFAWLCLLIASLGLGELRTDSPGPQELRRRQEAFASRLHPGATAFYSWWSSAKGESIAPVIDESELASLSLPWAPTPQEDRAKPSIVIISVESLRHDVIAQLHDGRPVAPRLDRLAQGGIHLTRAYAQSTLAAHTDPGIVSSLYLLRRRENRAYRADEPWPKLLVYDLLKSVGYATAVISSQDERFENLGAFLKTPNLDFFFDWDTNRRHAATPDKGPESIALQPIDTKLRSKIDDADVVTLALQWIGAQSKARRPFYLGLKLHNTRFDYRLPPSAQRLFHPAEIDFPATFAGYPVDRVNVVRNAYLNAVHYCDQQIGRVVDELQALGCLENTIVVVVGEHGEAFLENGCIATHGSMPMEPVVRVPCIIYGPRFAKPREENYPVEQIDLIPTLFGLLGWPSHPNFQGIDVLSHLRPPLDRRLQFFFVDTPLARCEAVMLAGRWKLIRDRVRNKDGLFDVVRDSQEKINLIKQPEFDALAEQLREVLASWRTRQLAYYQYPTYYRHYYPPHAPALNEAARLPSLQPPTQFTQATSPPGEQPSLLNSLRTGATPKAD